MSNVEITLDVVTPEVSERLSLFARVKNTLKNVASLSELLRITGAGIVVASMSSFILQDWGSGNDIQRYFLLLAQTVLLAGGGFAMSYLLKENKGARIFFGLSLISLSANFTILGALVYSLTQWDMNLSQYPGFAHWIATSPQSLMLTVGTALAVMLPVAWFGFMIMSRPAAGRLTAIYLLMNGLLLLPLRSSAMVGLMVVIGLVLLSTFSRRLLGNEQHFHTPSGRFAQVLLYMPLAVMIGRSAFLYSPDAFLVFAVSAAFYLGLRAFSQQLADDNRGKPITDFLGYVSSYAIAISLANTVEPLISWHYVLPLSAVALVALTLELRGRSRHAGLNSAMTLFTGVAFALSFVVNLLGSSSVIVPLMSFAAGSVMIGYGWIKGEKRLLVIGFVPLLFGSYELLHEVWHFLFSNSWISLAAIGTTTIVMASVLERYGATVKLKIQQWRENDHSA
ncbi:MAG: hypothetical protein GY792_30700 [Gammaproteobacteria bacterium]|nr:hypothetical protein [Gammaproteobacteria bacterium]